MATRTKDCQPADAALGAVIRMQRLALKLSQEAVAERIGTTFQQVQKYEKAANRVSFSRLVVLAQALDLTPDRLVIMAMVEVQARATVDELTRGGETSPASAATAQAEA